MSATRDMRAIRAATDAMLDDLPIIAALAKNEARRARLTGADARLARLRYEVEALEDARSAAREFGA